MKIIKNTRTTHTLEVSGDKIKEILGLPDSAKVTFSIPTGGDYSGMTLNVTDLDPVIITWVTND